MKAVILYGPPGSGKSTVTNALCLRSSAYVPFRRLKAGTGRTAEYRMATLAEIDALDAQGEILWRNDRYGSTYAIDRSQLLSQVANAVPVVHLGQPEAVSALIAAIPDVRWYVIALHCPYEVAIQRIRDRGDADLEARKAAWLETPPLSQVDLTIDTTNVTPDDIAAQIDALVSASP